MDLSQAIADVETAQSALSSADAAQAQAQQKYETALAAKGKADTDDTASVTAFNGSLDALIAAATAAKVSRAALP